MVAKSSLLFPTFFSTGAVKRSRKLVPEREEGEVRITERYRNRFIRGGMCVSVCVCVCVYSCTCVHHECQ